MTEPQAFDSTAFRAALGGFPTGVAIVTRQQAEGIPAGITISSFNSVSLNPPLILWSLMRSSPRLNVFTAEGYFAVNLLAEDQSALSDRFASKRSDKFGGLPHRPGLGGAPLLQGCVAHFECRRWATYDGGDHVIIVGAVERFRHWDRAPLVFARGRYGALQPAAEPIGDALWPISLG